MKVQVNEDGKNFKIESISPDDVIIIHMDSYDERSNHLFNRLRADLPNNKIIAMSDSFFNISILDKEDAVKRLEKMISYIKGESESYGDREKSL